jgi:hypothetical protein
MGDARCTSVFRIAGDHKNFCTAVRVVSHKTQQLLEWFGTADTPRASLDFPLRERSRADHHTTGRATSLRSLRGQVRAAPTEQCSCENVGRNGADRPFLPRSSKPPRRSQLGRMIRMKFACGGPARPIALPAASGTFSSPCN